MIFLPFVEKKWKQIHVEIFCIRLYFMETFFAKPKIMTQWVKKAKKVLVLVRKISKFDTFEIFFIKNLYLLLKMDSN